MKPADLSARRPLGPASLPSDVSLHRVQLAAPRATSVSIGPVIVAPPGIMACRCDLPTITVAYFTFDETTAVYETWARRDARSIPLTEIAKRELLTVTVAGGAGLTIADLRPHTTDWPALQSVRYASSQELTADLAGAGYDGVLYHSAQQFATQCVALFGPAARAVKRVSNDPLYDAATARLHRCIADAARGAELPVVR